ncbi:MAG: AAA family ATPase [Mycolicibacterium sp.]
MVFAEREQELGVLAARSADARAGRGGMVIVSGESGVGKTSFVETFLECRADGSRVLWGMCDPLSTPRPLGPIHDLAGHFGETTQRSLLGSDHPHETFAAVFEELRKVPSVLVIDDLHWADQAVVDLLRFVLRRIRHTHSLVIGTVRDDDIGISHPMRALLGDVARSTSATSLELPPLSLGAVTKLVGARPIDPVGLHRITGGNAFFVVEMLDHAGSDLPPRSGTRSCRALWISGLTSGMCCICWRVRRGRFRTISSPISVCPCRHCAPWPTRSSSGRPAGASHSVTTCADSRWRV